MILDPLSHTQIIMPSNPIETAHEAIDAIVEHASNAVDTYASDVHRLDEEIEDQFEEYRRCGDPDFRSAYSTDIEDLIGRRRTHYEAIFDSIEEAENALHEIQTAVERAFADLEAFSDGGEKIPAEDEFSIPGP